MNAVEIIEAIKRLPRQEQIEVVDLARQVLESAESGRVTNVDPLPDKVLKRLYGQVDDDADSIRTKPMG